MQTLRRKVGITLRGHDVGVAQKLLHFVDAHTRIDQSAGKTMAQVVQSKVRQIRVCSHPFPRFPNIVVRLERLNRAGFAGG